MSDAPDDARQFWFKECRNRARAAAALPCWYFKAQYNFRLWTLDRNELDDTKCTLLVSRGVLLIQNRVYIYKTGRIQKMSECLFWIPRGSRNGMTFRINTLKTNSLFRFFTIWTQACSWKMLSVFFNTYRNFSQLTKTKQLKNTL